MRFGTFSQKPSGELRLILLTELIVIISAGTLLMSYDLRTWPLWVRIIIFCIIVIVSGVVLFGGRQVSWNSLDGNSRAVLETFYDYFKDSPATVGDLQSKNPDLIKQGSTAHAIMDLVAHGLVREGVPFQYSMSTLTIQRYDITRLGKELVERHRATQKRSESRG
jgi:hypothetical protein